MTSGGVRPAKPARPELSAKRASGNAPRLSFGEWAVTRGHRIVAPHGERTKRAGNSTVIWIRKCATLAVANFAKGREVSTGRLGVLSLAQPTAHRPCQRFKVPSVRKVVPSETRKRRSSDRSLRSTLAICSGGLDSVPLLAQWQLSTNSPASCLSITANGLRKKLVSPALCGANEQFYRSSTSAKKSTRPK